MEQRIGKTPNFKEVNISTSTTHSQSFKVLGCFVLELLGFIFYVYTIFLCSVTEFIKNVTNNWKTTKFQETLWNTWTRFSQNFNAVACFILELLSFIFCVYIFKFLYISKLHRKNRIYK